jgi:hypothetical protein
VNGSFVFAEQGQQSRDKFMSSGQNVAVKGVVVGYYLFKRSETNRVNLPKPWELPIVEAPGPDDEVAVSEEVVATPVPEETSRGGETEPQRPWPPSRS